MTTKKQPAEQPTSPPISLPLTSKQAWGLRGLYDERAIIEKRIQEMTGAILRAADAPPDREWVLEFGDDVALVEVVD